MSYFRNNRRTYQRNLVIPCSYVKGDFTGNLEHLHRSVQYLTMLLSSQLLQKKSFWQFIFTKYSILSKKKKKVHWLPVTSKTV